MPFNINDSVSPEAAPLTIIGALNALAYQVRSITGGETWKTTPPTSIQAAFDLTTGQNTVFQSSGDINLINDIIELKNGNSTLKIQGEKSNQQVDRYYFNWLPDNNLNATLTPGGLYFGYFYGNSQLGLQNTGISLIRNGANVCDIETYPNQLVFQVPQLSSIRLQQPGGGGQMLQWTPYIGLKMYGAASQLYLESNSGVGTKLYAPDASKTALTVSSVSGQSADLAQFNDGLGVKKLSISSDIKIDFPEGSNTPTDTTALVGWIEIKINGETAYIPAYK